MLAVRDSIDGEGVMVTRKPRRTRAMPGDISADIDLYILWETARNHRSQEWMAGRLHITQQAVSRRYRTLPASVKAAMPGLARDYPDGLPPDVQDRIRSAIREYRNDERDRRRVRKLNRTVA